MTTTPESPGDAVTAALSRLRSVADDGLPLGAVAAGPMAALLGVDALTLCGIAADGGLELVWSDPANVLGVELDDLQYIHGEGPSLDAARLGTAVSATDLTAISASRWPVFQPAALSRGARAVIATPLMLGASVIGVLTGYRTTSGAFPREQQHNIGRFAQIARTLLLQTPMGPSLSGARADTDLVFHRAEVHQATGILAVQLDLPLGAALARLRAHAYRHDRALLDVARDIIAHRLHLEAP
ncbi:GAF domain-containing protein [Amycolatopsis sp. CA-230715]|uniref:GAF domain-containing protein n=1 Tax=Amycolatopsis sp. CA-230715 TaxID=2745196 RepID=UPI001C00BDC2|nr:GAF domain-containing protein [Amycolatopsis sp. CA-230715]QWF77852.1 hypothetical protein HUW46_01245 [Amycolatopsis sp. CA-230715]